MLSRKITNSFFFQLAGMMIGSFLFALCAFVFLYSGDRTHVSHSGAIPVSGDGAILFATDIQKLPANSTPSSFRAGEQLRNSQNQISTRHTESGAKTKSPGSFDTCRSFYRTTGTVCLLCSLREPLYLWNQIFLN